MKVLFVASEVAPFIKVGGLGDVAGSLPKALQNIDVDIDVVVPFFPSAKVDNVKIYKSVSLNVPFDSDTKTVDVYVTKLPGSDVDVFLLKNDSLFEPGGKSAFNNNQKETEMFMFFCKAVVELIKTKYNTYDLIHCNDWHSGLLTYLLEDEIGSDRPATIITIHNFMYQGEGSLELVKAVGLDATKHKSVAWDLSDGRINMLMQGIISADFVNTVSPTYAKEILTEEFGGSLGPLLKGKEGRLLGILNGIDYSSFPRQYGLADWHLGKSIAKDRISERLKLERGESPIFSFVSRLDAGQKGLDILFENIEYIAKNGSRFILLGSGDPDWQEKFLKQATDLNRTYGDRVSINIAFDASLAIEIYSASDFFFIPSRYEPCGLTQMISMWYGAIPIARSTGGLRDSIKEGKTGLLFTEYDADSLLKVIKKAFNIFDSPIYREMVENCLTSDFSFDKSALLYKELYEKAIQIRKESLEWNSDL